MTHPHTPTPHALDAAERGLHDPFSQTASALCICAVWSCSHACMSKCGEDAHGGSGTWMRRQLCWFGFHVLDLRPWVSWGGQGSSTISVHAWPYTADWRMALVRVQV